MQERFHLLITGLKVTGCKVFEMEECRVPLHWHYQMLDEDKKVIYQSILSQIRRAEWGTDHESPFFEQCFATQSLLQVRVPRSDAVKKGFYEKEIYNDILMGILLDDSSLFQLDLTEVSFYQEKSSLTMILKLVYDSDTYQLLLNQMQAKAQEICGRVKLIKTEKQKILYLHDYLCGECEYDARSYSGLWGNPYIQSREIHTMIGALQNESCVCDGLASAFLYLCEQCDIACIHVRGQLVKDEKAKTHAWNVVKCEGKYWHMDLCLDHLDSESSVAKGYCFRTDLDMEETHRWDKTRYPKTDSDKIKRIKREKDDEYDSAGIGNIVE